MEMMVAKGHPISMARASGWRGNFTCEQTKLPNNGWHDLNKKHVNNHDQNDDDNEVHFDVIYLQE